MAADEVIQYNIAIDDNDAMQEFRRRYNMELVFTEH